MIKVVSKNNGHLCLNNDDEVISDVLASLCRNNTFCPNVTKCYLMKNVDRKIVDKETKKKVVVKRDVLKVSFADDTWTEVVRNPNEQADDSIAIVYAIIKRMFGEPNAGGYVAGGGFMKRIQKMAQNIITPEKEEEEKQARIKTKAENDKKAHEEAVARRESNPSLGLRVHNLEKKFDELMDILKSSQTK